MPKKTKTPNQLARSIVADQIASVIDPHEFVWANDLVEQAAELVDRLAEKGVLSSDAIVAFEDKLRETAPHLLTDYIKVSDSHGLDAVAHLEAGVLLGMELARAVSMKGGR